MFYLLFRYLKDAHEQETPKVYLEFKSKDGLINFIKEKRDEIEIAKIIEAGREFKLNWILKLEEVGKPYFQRRGRPKKEKGKPECEPECEPDEEEPIEGEGVVEEKPKISKKKKTEAILERSNAVIEMAKKGLEDKAIKWELCVKCGKNKVVSSSKRKICSECLEKEKKQASDKRKKEILLNYESTTQKEEE